MMVFLNLWSSRLDPGTWHVVPAIPEWTADLFLRSSFPFANYNTNSVFICERGSFIYLASVNLIILMTNLISKNKVQKKQHYLFLDIVCFYTHTHIIFREHIYVCMCVYISMVSEYFFKVNFDDIQWSSLWCMKLLQSDDHFPHKS